MRSIFKRYRKRFYDVQMSVDFFIIVGRIGSFFFSLLTEHISDFELAL